MENFPGSNLGDWPSSCSIDSNFILDDIWKDTHGSPIAKNSHNHTKLVVEHDEDDNENKFVNNNSNDTAESTDKKKHDHRNREAVRKYRERKKARAACLEDELVKLREVNQQLLKRVQSQAALEAEIGRLKCLLVDIRGRIEGEIGSFPYQKRVNSNVAALPDRYEVTPLSVQRDNNINGFHFGAEGALLNEHGFSNHDLKNLQYLGNQDFGAKELAENGLGNGVSNANSSGARKKKGGPRAATAG